MQKLVSVVIPFYSGIEWLGEAVESVLNQTYSNIEIIVVNDGSLEDDSAFLSKYGQKITYYKKENGGPSSARNYGILHAKGYYIALLDSDDVWLPEKTELQIRFMEERGIMWSHTGFCYWHPDTGNLQKVNVSKNYGVIGWRRYLSFRMSTPSVIFRKEIFDTHPEMLFNEGIRYGEDGEMFTRLGRVYQLGLLDNILMWVRIRGTNTYSQYALRINMGADGYMKLKELEAQQGSVPMVLKLVDWIYFQENKLLKYLKEKELGKDKIESIASFLILIPVGIAHLYSNYLYYIQRNDKKYYCR